MIQDEPYAAVDQEMIDSVKAPKSMEILQENAHLSDMVGLDHAINLSY